MRALVLFAAIALSATQATAIERHNSMNYSCQGILRLLDAKGAVILRYPSKRNPSLTLYDRYVRNRNMCSSTQIAVSTSVPTSDTQSCRVLHCINGNLCDDDALFCSY